ncbi:MAG: mechanosensitive ion channel family protein, partial [Alphaproteobacteria bacterium]|nr:mechanosensitive ion channel family protein [Alphaproteobacteria bacterium]
FTTIIVENPSRMSHRRIFETIGLRYVDVAKMQEITDAVRKLLMEHKEIDEQQTLMVYFNSFNNSSIDFFIYCFTHTTAWSHYHEVKHEILLKISDIIHKHEAEIAFPTQTLHLPDALRVDTTIDADEEDDEEDTQQKASRKLLSKSKKSKGRSAVYGDEMDGGD